MKTDFKVDANGNVYFKYSKQQHLLRILAGLVGVYIFSYLVIIGTQVNHFVINPMIPIIIFFGVLTMYNVYTFYTNQTKENKNIKRDANGTEYFRYSKRFFLFLMLANILGFCPMFYVLYLVIKANQFLIVAIFIFVILYFAWSIYNQYIQYINELTNKDNHFFTN